LFEARVTTTGSLYVVKKDNARRSELALLAEYGLDDRSGKCSSASSGSAILP
jgi:hypothetical protein